MNGMDNDQFFDFFGFDPIFWTVPHKPDEAKGDYCDPLQREVRFLESRRIFSEKWRIESEELPGRQFKTVRYHVITPKGTLTFVVQSNGYTTWVIEHLIKEKRDIDLIAEYATTPKCDIEEVNKAATEFGERGIIRGHICGSDIFGQPGCWQDACCIVGTERMIMETYDDPEWVHEILKILQKERLALPVQWQARGMIYWSAVEEMHPPL